MNRSDALRTATEQANRSGEFRWVVMLWDGEETIHKAVEEYYLTSSEFSEFAGRVVYIVRPE